MSSYAELLLELPLEERNAVERVTSIVEVAAAYVKEESEDTPKAVHVFTLTQMILNETKTK